MTGESCVSYERQTDYVDPVKARELHVSVIGLGTVGSNVAVELARMGVGSMSLIDGDVVEAHNLPSQAYTLADLNRPKADALLDRVRAVSDHVRLDATQAMLVGGESFPAGPVVLAVDSMDARRAILEGSVAWRPSHSLVIDARMGGEIVQLYAFDPSHQSSLDRWTAEWHPSERSAPLPCGGRSVSFVGGFVGSLIATYIARHLRGGSVPFWTQIDLGTLHLLQISALDQAAGS